MTELPPTWCATTVAAISDPLRYGYTASADPEADGPKMLRITDIQNGQVHWPTVPRCEIAPGKQDDFLVSPGDIVFARTGGTVGKSFLIREVPEPAVFASYLIKVGPATGVEPRYLYWFFQSLGYWDQIALKKGGLQGNVNAKTLGSIELPFAPANEQRRIAEKIEALFGEIDKGVESLRAAKSTLDLYRKSSLKSAFEGRLTADWRAQNPDKLENPNKLLTRIQEEREKSYRAALDQWEKATAEWRNNGKQAKKPTKPKQPRTIPSKPTDNEAPSSMTDLPAGWTVCRIGDVLEPVEKTGKHEEDRMIWYVDISSIDNKSNRIRDPKRISWAEAPSRARQKIRSGDVLFSTVRPYLRNIALVGRTLNGEIASTGFAVLRGAKGIEPRYLFYKCISHDFVSALTGEQYGVSYPAVKENQVKEQPFELPPINEQAQIVRILEARLEVAETLSAEIDASLARAEALRQSILKEAFTGKLVAQDSTEEPAQALLARIRANSTKATITTRDLR